MNVSRSFLSPGRAGSVLVKQCFVIAMLAMIFASVALPIVNSANAQSSEPPNCPTFQRWDANAGRCVPLLLDVTQKEESATETPAETSVPDVLPSETPILVEAERDETVPTEAATQVAADETTGTALINKHRCPSGYDAAGKSYYDLAADCTDSPDGLLFGISDGAAEFQTATTGSYGPGMFQLTDLPLAGSAIYEKNVVPGTTSVIFCDGYTPEEGGPSDWGSYYQTAENQMFYDFSEAPLLYCDWFNVVPAEATGSVIIDKIGCSAGYDASAEDYDDLVQNCLYTVNGIEFGVSDGATEIATATTGSPNDGNVTITDLPAGPLSIYEKNAAMGQGSVVFCDGVLMQETSINQIFYVLADGETLHCVWFNVAETPVATPPAATPPVATPTAGYGDIIVYKWSCPAGFDPESSGADPSTVCSEALDGVTFTLDRPNQDSLQSNTGDSVPGAVTFGGQNPGTYVITETIPEGFGLAFVWDCSGLSQGQVNPTPLSIGTSLTINLAANDVVTCNWYNVEEVAPNTGHISLTKFICSGPTFVSDVDCETYEYGKTFSLSVWTGTEWQVIDTQTTSGSGTINWLNLAVGDYRVTEKDAVPCHTSTTSATSEGDLAVRSGETIVLQVYNCTPVGETPEAGSAPSKYPNTGVPPSNSIRIGVAR